MRRCFEVARTAAPCILLVDEVDAFIDRDRQHDNGEYMRGVVNGFLELLDGAKDRDGVVVIGACNNPAGIDPAVTRSGRLDRHIRIAHPDVAARSHILRYHLQSDLDVSSLMQRTEGFSGADLERLARDARRLARRQRSPVQIDHVIAALPQTRLLTADEVRASALHEIGHAVVAVILGHRHLNKVVISKELPTRTETAVTSIGHAHFSGGPARRVRSWYEDEICVMLASIAAETVFLGCHDDGAANDLSQATQAAVHMLSIAGFGESLVSDAGREKTFWHHRQEAEIDAILREQLQRATGIVEEHRDVIEHLARILAEAGELDGAVVRRAVAERSLLEPAFTA
ncbi:AAA family ATPase [Rhizobium sp. LjRoot30]|uniref:AAA family ATPase n=1 Tax=Rhizobium sp. LjRoot30 TaxID=3342320 RepID=UPI003ECC9CD8